MIILAFGFRGYLGKSSPWRAAHTVRFTTQQMENHAPSAERLPYSILELGNVYRVIRFGCGV